ncbi:hypothetical protein [Paracoccus sp. T5]|uniref:hypothetical protein n=1 Tax=Paracoccus sp. T5 TaxID=3402161 RepID=UPI003AD8E904
MTELALTEVPVDAAVKSALAAAEAATDAAHEAEAVLSARSEAAEAVGRTARRMGILTGVSAGSALLVLALAGSSLWSNTSSLNDAATVQAAASAAFVERLGEMNIALDRMEKAVAETERLAAAQQSRMEAEAQAPRTPAPAAVPGAPEALSPELAQRLDSLRSDLLAAIAEVELSVGTRLSHFVPPTAPAAATPAAATPAAAPQASAARPAAPRRAAPAAKPRPRTAPAPAAQAPNPFRYP